MNKIFYARFNNWGTNNIQEIEEKIYDQTDNFNRGIVEYEPIVNVS